MGVGQDPAIPHRTAEESTHSARPDLLAGSDERTHTTDGSSATHSNSAWLPGQAEPGFAAETAAVVPSDQLRIDRYTVLYPLGRGGMGVVYAAYDPKLDRNVALKLLPTRRAKHQRSKQRLIREARALAKLSHPHVVQVHDVGEYRETIYIAMELVEGHPLSQWSMKTPRPSWRDILGVYREAAQGLAAAHAKGLIHRDFKPSNVLIGRDGRARVVDFGVAFVHSRGLSSQDSRPDASAGPDDHGNQDAGPDSADESVDSRATGLWQRAISERITHANALLGSPSYMAPEQHDSAEVSAAADQYSLCASLYQSLYGEPPFVVPKSPEWLSHLRDRKRQGLREPPENTEVPIWLFRVLQRGLAPDPAERFPSMDELIRALSNDPQALRRSRIRTAALAGGSSILALGLAALLMVLPKEHPYTLCIDEGRDLPTRWQEAKTNIQDMFLATKHPNAAGTYERVAQIVTTYVDSWLAMHQEVCTAAHAAEMSASATPDVALRADCLDISKHRLIEQLAIFAQADTDVLNQAVWAVMRLPAIADCSNVDRLRAAPSLPRSSAARDQVSELFRRLERVQVLFANGKYRAAQAEVASVLRQSPAVRFPAVDGWARYWSAKIHQELGDYGAARTLFQQALEHAAEAGHDDLIALCWLGQITMLSGRLGRHEEAMSLVSAAEIAVKRARNPQLDRDLADAVGFIAMGQGKLSEAYAHYQRALMLGQTYSGLEHPDVVWAVHNLALVSQRLGQLDKATEGFERSIELWEKSLGPDHPNLAHPLTNLGLALHDQGAYEKARTVLMRALAIREASFGPTHQELGYPLTNLGLVLNQLGRHDEARTYLLRAVAIWEKTFGPDHPPLGHALNNLGWAARALGDIPASRTYYQRTIELWERAYGPGYPALVYALEGLRDLEAAAGNAEAAGALTQRIKALRPAN